MKFINNLFILMLVILGGCQMSTLTDVTANSFMVTASQGEFPDSVKVEWIKTEYYANFVVLRSSSENGIYMPITEKIDTIEIEDKQNIVEGVSYYYKVQGYNNIGTAMFLTEPTEGFAGSGGGFLPPKDIKITTGESTTSLELSWLRVGGAKSYEIARSEDNTNFDIIDAVPYLSYEDKNVTVGKKYYYQITSLDKDGIPSPDRSQTVEGSLFGADLNLSTESGAYADKIVLTWQPYEYATEYQLYRSTTNGIMGEVVETFKKSDTMEYTDIDVVSTDLYYYSIVYQNDSGAKDQSATVRNYLKTDNAPAKPTGFTASQGVNPKTVELKWNAVEGATCYEIARSISETGPWEIVTKTDKDSGITSYDDEVPNDSYTYFYTVTGFNPAPGIVSDVKEGWANKPPVNITASSSFGDKVTLTWDRVPGARSYMINFSRTEDGTYGLAGTAYPSSSEQVSFDHIYDIGANLEQDLFYKVSVTTSGQSLPSEPVKGAIKKMSAPQNVRVLKNNTATKSMTIAWDRISGANSYNIYRATLAHRGSDPNKLEIAHFKKVGSAQNAAYTLDFNTYPIRRYVYLVKGVDAGGAEGVLTKTELVKRFPVDLEDFAKDVDYTIVEAQTQVPNFGYQGSGGSISGRAQGKYDYYAGMSGSKNIWSSYSSFETILDGAQSVTISISPMGAYLNGPANISGLYNGKITYTNLLAAEGGFVLRGSMTIEYKHPTKGWLKETWDASKAGAILQSVVLSGSESAPRKPTFEVGNG